MALPLAPIALVAVRYGGVALAAYYAARKIQLSQTDQATEDALDSVVEGVSAHKCTDAQQANAGVRWRRVVRWGDAGPGLEIDMAALGRVRVRKV